jgi:hypothetical protein
MAPRSVLAGGDDIVDQLVGEGDIPAVLLGAASAEGCAGTAGGWRCG